MAGGVLRSYCPRSQRSREIPVLHPERPSEAAPRACAGRVRFTVPPAHASVAHASRVDAQTVTRANNSPRETTPSAHLASKPLAISVRTSVTIVRCSNLIQSPIRSLSSLFRFPGPAGLTPSVDRIGRVCGRNAGLSHRNQASKRANGASKRANDPAKRRNGAAKRMDGGGIHPLACHG